jgi:nickel transport protein
MIKFNSHKHLAKPVFYLCLVVCVVCTQIEFADAHRVNLFAWVEGDTVYVESKFSSGKHVNGGKITVTDPKGTVLINATTDENGKFSFKVPQKTELKIVLEAGTGHRAEWTIADHEIEKPAAGQGPASGKDTTVKNIIIGLGFIFGLTAVAAYFRKRKKR